MPSLAPVSPHSTTKGAWLWQSSLFCEDCPLRASPRGHAHGVRTPANTWPHCVISLDDIRLMIAGSAQVRNRLQSEHGKRFNDMVVAMGRT